MEEINKNISAKLKGLRAEKGFSLEEMAEKIGGHRETLINLWQIAKRKRRIGERRWI